MSAADAIAAEQVKIISLTIATAQWSPETDSEIRGNANAALARLADRLAATEAERDKAIEQRDRLAAILDPKKLNRAQRRAGRYGDGINSQFDDSVRQGG